MRRDPGNEGCYNGGLPRKTDMLVGNTGRYEQPRTTTRQLENPWGGGWGGYEDFFGQV
jgi:hypothetical protein